MSLTPFNKIRALAEKRKGGKDGLSMLLKKPLSVKQLQSLGDDRYLAMMTRCIFNAGFNWKVIEHKWEGFESAFHGFNPRGLSHMPPEKWEAYLEDRRVVRNWTKIQAIRENAVFVLEEAEKHGSFAQLIAAWPASDQVGLMLYLKKHGSRLGGNTGMYFLRFMGKDGFILSRDVVSRLRASGVEIREQPGSKRDLLRAQDAFNAWHQQTGLSYTHLSRIAAFSINHNYPNA